MAHDIYLILHIKRSILLLLYEKPVCVGALSKEELNAELEKGYADLQAGRTKPLEQAIAEMHRDFKI